MSWVVVTSALGIICVLASLVGLGMASLTRGHWGTAATCLGAFALILFLLLVGLEYADGFWEGK